MSAKFVIVNVSDGGEHIDVTPDADRPLTSALPPGCVSDVFEVSTANRTWWPGRVSASSLLPVPVPPDEWWVQATRRRR